MRYGLRQRVLDGLELEIELFGGSSKEGSVLRPPGVIAAVSPSTPERSLFNSVFAVDPPALADSIDSLAATYERAGVRAWTVWVPDEDRESAALLADRGHALDGAPRSMGLELSDLRPAERPLPPGVVHVKIDPETGLLAYPGQRNAIYEYFRIEYVPDEAPGAPQPGSGSRGTDDLIKDIF